jgi:transcription antitermination factor NusG
MAGSVLESGFRPAAQSGIASIERNWYAVFTLPQNEKSTIKHLALREVEAFLPTYETLRVWKNRQKVKVVLPLFPTYLFVHIDPRERVRVLQTPGVIHIVGSHGNPVAISNAEIDLLRSGFCGKKVEPYADLVVGERVRIRSGPMQGVVGTLVRRKGGVRFVLAIEMIHQNAAIEIDADYLEPLTV